MPNLYIHHAISMFLFPFREQSDSLATVSTSLGRKGEQRRKIFDVENWDFDKKACFPFHKRKMALNVSIKKGAVGTLKRTMKINYCCIIVKARIHAVVNTQLRADNLSEEFN